MKKTSSIIFFLFWFSLIMSSTIGYSRSFQCNTISHCLNLYANDSILYTLGNRCSRNGGFFTSNRGVQTKFDLAEEDNYSKVIFVAFTENNDSEWIIKSGTQIQNEYVRYEASKTVFWMNGDNKKTTSIKVKQGDIFHFSNPNMSGSFIVISADLDCESDLILAPYNEISTATYDLNDFYNDIQISNNQIAVNGVSPQFVITSMGQKIVNKDLKKGIYFVIVDGKRICISKN